MAMDKDTLGALMTTKVQAIPGLTITDAVALTAYHKALADALITHMIAVGEVLPGTLKDSTNVLITGKGMMQ